LDAVGLLGPLPQRPVVHLDAGYDWEPCRQVLRERGMAGEIATRGKPAPVQASRRWSLAGGAHHAWGIQYGKLRWCPERRRIVVEFWLALVNAVIVGGRLIRRAWACYRLAQAISRASRARSGLGRVSFHAAPWVARRTRGNPGPNQSAVPPPRVLLLQDEEARARCAPIRTAIDGASRPGS
jgi:hypothetical protein